MDKCYFCGLDATYCYSTEFLAHSYSCKNCGGYYLYDYFKESVNPDEDTKFKVACVLAEDVLSSPDKTRMRPFFVDELPSGKEPSLPESFFATVETFTDRYPSNPAVAYDRALVNLSKFFPDPSKINTLEYSRAKFIVYRNSEHGALRVLSDLANSGHIFEEAACSGVYLFEFSRKGWETINSNNNPRSNEMANASTIYNINNHVTGDNNQVAQVTGNGQITQTNNITDVFNEMRAKLVEIEDEADRASIEEAINGMEASQNTPEFKGYYSTFINKAANYMTLFATFSNALVNLSTLAG